MNSDTDIYIEFFLKFLEVFKSIFYLFLIEYNNFKYENLKLNSINGDKIKLKVDIKILDTPPMSPSNYKKLYDYLEWMI